MTTRFSAYMSAAVSCCSVLLLAACSRDAAPPRTYCRAALDADGEFLILATEKASDAYAEAIAEAKTLHPNAGIALFSLAGLDALLADMRAVPPRYAIVFMLPAELDVNFAWQWLAMTARLDDDPFVDLRAGFVTGADTASALAFVKRIAMAARGEIKIPFCLADNLGPNPQAPRGSCHVNNGSFMLPAFADAMRTREISHGLEGFTADRLALMEDAGFVHYGGHGYPDRVVDSLNAVFLRRMRFAPCVFFNGACYTGVTHAWYDMEGTVLRRHTEPVSKSFCLAALAGGPVAYLAALHPDHGIPVYQEMEYMAYSGAPLGDVIKHTYDSVVLGAGGALPAFDEFSDGMPVPRWTPAEYMLKGAAARVLFGDPSMSVSPPFCSPPFRVECAALGRELRVTAEPENLMLKNEFTETFFSDMSETGQFNDRALITCELPQDWTSVAGLENVSAEIKGRPLAVKLVGFGVEADGGKRLLHALFDLPSTGYRDGPFRNAGARLVFDAAHARP